MTNSNGAPPQQGHGLDGFYETLRRPGIVRSSDGKWFAGVSTGLARWLGVDPLIVRAGFILFSIFFGMGVALYLTLWLLMPDERGEIHLERALKHGEGSSIFLLIVTAISVLGGGPWWGGDTQGLRFGGFIIVAVLAWYFLTRTDRGRDLIGWPWNSGEQGRGGSTGATSSTTGSTGTGETGTSAVGTGSTGNAAANAGAAFTGQRTASAASAPTASAPTRPAPPAPPVRAPREHVRSIGFAAGMLVLGAAVLTGALFTQLAKAGDWPGNPIAVGIAAGLGILGLGILVAGMAGRRSGGLALFAWLGIFGAVFATAAPAGLTQPWQIGERDYAPASATSPMDYQVAMGNLQLDLTKLTAAELAKTTGPDTVKATVGLGELDIVVPKGVHVVVNAKGRAGEVVATDSNAPSIDTGMRKTGTDEYTTDGVRWEQTVSYGTESQPTELVVDAEVGLGSIQISTASAS